jgi:DNA-binding beta-propeller fold protein YncE
MKRLQTLAYSCLFLSLAIQARAQFIDFETLPGGAPTIDQQPITSEYAAFGVTFTLLDRNTGLPIGAPRIAKAGEPQTAFEGCSDADTPRPEVDLGESFLTDGTQVGVEGDLLIEYAMPVSQASGVILDIDCRVGGGPPCEQWTITAFDALGNVVDTVVLDAPQGSPNPECVSPGGGPGDSEAFGWVVTAEDALIRSIVLRYTGAAANVGLAFDSFSVAGPPTPLVATVTEEADRVCSGESIELSVLVSGGLPPFTYRWQRQITQDVWTDLDTAPSQTVQPVATSRFRVLVTDASLNEVVSNEVEVFVAEGDPLCDAGLLVSSFENDRVVQYGFISELNSVLVPSGSGSLNGTSKLICGPDGNLYVSSQLNDRILRYDGATGGFIDVFVTQGSGGLNLPIGLGFGPDGNLYVVSNQNNSVRRYDGTTGAFIDVFVPNGSGLNNPTGLVFGPDGNLYVSSLDGDKVLRFDGITGGPLGDFVTARSGGLDTPRGLIFGPDGNLYVAEQVNDSVRRYDGTTGAFIDVFVPAGSGGLDRANDVAFGLDGDLYVASFNNDRVLRFDGDSGAYVSALPDEMLDGPAWLTVGCQSEPIAAVDSAPSALSLRIDPAYPNPFNPRTTVRFTLPLDGDTQVTVVDMGGRVVAHLLNGNLSAGEHSVEWDGLMTDGRAAPSGVYLMNVNSGAIRQSVKLVLLR